MRMWMTDPKIMCRKHLLGQHVELHMLVVSLQKDKSIQGFLDNNLLFPQFLELYHDEIVQEMVRRGYNHKSPINLTDKTKDQAAKLSLPLTPELMQFHERELISRCDNCKHLYTKRKTNAREERKECVLPAT